MSNIKIEMDAVTGAVLMIVIPAAVSGLVRIAEALRRPAPVYNEITIPSDNMKLQ